jgi:UDP-3-O-[3-hydroxymyristoyl] N-acetylglucosamine deacetylase/3-hydroxyacyl-[acyl-carrier-protein] dehydratase
MNIKQHTIKKAVTVSGVGLHTGVPVNMTFLPAKPGHGYKFQRVDLEGQPTVDADVDNVVDLSRGTTIEQSGARINTVEHTLAALVGLELDNVLIQLDGPEPPIMDGSSIKFIEVLESAGMEEQNALRNYYEITEEIRYRDKERNVEIAALPLNDYRLTVMVDYNSPVLGSQHASITDIKQFPKEIAACRTFCFLHELEMLHKQNLVKGGDLNNAIVIVDRVIRDDELDYLAALFNRPKVEVKKEGILNNVELRYKNEPARHKLLDLTRLLPHRYPFQFVDKVFYMDENTVAGVKNVTINEPFFEGHFPGNPVFPGVFQIEAMAQTGGILVLSSVPDPENYWTYFLGVESCRFKKMVFPGDTLIFKCELLAPIKRGIAKMHGEAYVGGTLVCEAVLTASIVRKNK